MDVLLELLIKLLSLTVIMIFLIGLLFVMLISIVYIAGYVYDSIFGNSFISLGHYKWKISENQEYSDSCKTVEKNTTKRIIFAI